MADSAKGWPEAAAVLLASPSTEAAAVVPVVAASFAAHPRGGAADAEASAGVAGAAGTDGEAVAGLAEGGAGCTAPAAFSVLLSGPEAGDEAAEVICCSGCTAGCAPAVPLSAAT